MSIDIDREPVEIFLARSLVADDLAMDLDSVTVEGYVTASDVARAHDFIVLHDALAAYRNMTPPPSAAGVDDGTRVEAAEAARDLELAADTLAALALSGSPERVYEGVRSADAIMRTAVEVLRRVAL